MTEEQKKHIEECTTKASTNACNAIEELIDEFDDIFTNNPDDEELSLEMQKHTLAACSATLRRGLVAVSISRGFFLEYILRVWDEAEKIKIQNEKEKDA